MIGSLRRLRRPCLALVPAALLCAGTALADVGLRARLETTEAVVGESITLTIEAEGAQDVPAPAVPAPDGVSVRYAGPSTQVSIVNGRISASVQHRYLVTAHKEGAFTLGPFSASHGGREIEAPAVRFRASPAAPSGRQRGARGGDEAGGRELTLSIEAVPGEVYVQQRVPVTVALAVGGVRVDDLQYPTLAADGFAVDPFAGQPSQADEVRDGRPVRVLRFRTEVVPLRPGPQALGPARMSMNMVVSRRGRGGDPFFDQFFGMDPFAQKRPVELHADPVTLAVRPLPKEGKPADFGGAVGQFDFEATAQPADLRVGDPVTVRMRIAGAGNFAAIEAPRLPGDDRFKVYAPQAAAGAAAGEKVFEQVLIPLREDVREVPALRFSYFDPGAGGYRTIERGPFTLTVRAPEEPQAPRVVEAPGARDVAGPAERLGRDIVFIKESPGRLLRRGLPLYRAPWFLALQLLPLAIYTGCRWYARRRERWGADPRYARFMRAGGQARLALGAAERALRDGDGVRFDDELSRGLREYLAAKLDLPPGAVEAAQVAARIGSDGAARETAPRVARVFELLDQVRYAGAAGANTDREDALRLAREIVAALDRTRYRRRSTAAAGAAALAITAWQAVAAAFNPHAAFYEGNALYAESRFAEAEAAYERVREGGYESAAVHYNLGNACFKQGRLGMALVHYERAARLAPRDPDLRANAQFAREELEVADDAPGWRRMAFFLGERSSTSELAVAAGLLYAAAMLALSAGALRPGVAAAGRAAVWCGALAALCAANLGYRLAAYDLAAAAIVIRPGETAVRFEPSGDGTPHYVAREGMKLFVSERREGWLQVGRADGRRGWIEAEAVREVAS